jgi:integrase
MLSSSSSRPATTSSIVPWLCTLPLTAETNTWRSSPDNLVFSAPNGGMIYRTTFLRRVLAPASQQAGIGKVRTHDLRHTAGDLGLKNGATMEDVKAMLGHASIAITIDIYGHRDEDDAQSIQDAMDRAHQVATGRSSPSATMRGSG